MVCTRTAVLRPQCHISIHNLTGCFYVFTSAVMIGGHKEGCQLTLSFLSGHFPVLRLFHTPQQILASQFLAFIFFFATCSFRDCWQLVWSRLDVLGFTFDQDVLCALGDVTKSDSRASDSFDLVAGYHIISTRSYFRRTNICSIDSRKYMSKNQ